ncbi:HET-domain-containing protein [Venturia nashicola]|nr:HET-domain-containing protein [Venturia nashicola]
MADVYQNAHITLAATTSSDGNGGCYSANQETVREFEICPDILVREKCGGIMAACDPLEKVLLVRNINDLRDVTNKLPTKSRRWKNAKDRMANTVNSSIFSNIEEERILMAASSNTSDRGTLSQDKYFDQWHAIIEQYSALGLSRATDRLPALSGLAVRVSSIFGQYMCGLWYKNMLRDLLWRVALLHHDSVRPDCYTGPSWSWASINGAVKYWHDINDQRDQEEEAIRLIDQSISAQTWFERDEANRLLNRKTAGKSLVQWQVSQLRFSCEVESMGGNPFGEIITGRLHITGFMQRASLQYAHHPTASEQAQPLPYDPLQYLVSIQGVELTLPFFADYVLSEGPRKLLDGAAINLLLIHPNIALILLKHGRVFYTYERIGIVRQPSAYLALYNLNWMSENVMMTITIT